MPTCLILASATLSLTILVSHLVTTAHTATSRLQKQYGLHACMHVWARIHTHTHSVLHKYTKTKPFIHHLSPSLTYTPTHTHIHSSINAQKQNPLFPLSLTHTYIHTEMLSLLLTHLHIHRDAPPPSNHTRRQMLSLSCTHLHREHP